MPKLSFTPRQADITSVWKGYSIMDDMDAFIFYEAVSGFLNDVIYCEECEVGILYLLDTDEARAICDTCGQEYIIS